MKYLWFVFADFISPQLADLMNEIGAVIPAKWRAVGVQLGIDYVALNSIQSQNAGKPESDQKSFEQVFNEWKLQGSKPYTWGHIIDILQRPAIGKNELAKKLAAKFNKIWCYFSRDINKLVYEVLLNVSCMQ